MPSRNFYDLISHSSRSGAITIDAYLKAIAKAMSATLLGNVSGIVIDVEAQAVDIDPDRAVPFGLLVNELVTNAIKHAFPDRIGRVLLKADQIDNHIELVVADNGMGMSSKDAAAIPATRGLDYIAIFVRQLGGTIVPSELADTGTTVRIRFPAVVVPPGRADRVAA